MSTLGQAFSLGFFGLSQDAGQKPGGSQKWLPHKHAGESTCMPQCATQKWTPTLGQAFSLGIFGLSQDAGQKPGGSQKWLPQLCARLWHGSL